MAHEEVSKSYAKNTNYALLIIIYGRIGDKPQSTRVEREVVKLTEKRREMKTDILATVNVLKLGAGTEYRRQYERDTKKTYSVTRLVVTLIRRNYVTT